MLNIYIYIIYLNIHTYTHTHMCVFLWSEIFMIKKPFGSVKIKIGGFQKEIQ